MVESHESRFWAVILDARQRTANVRAGLVAFMIWFVHAIWVGYLAWHYAPNADEPAHLAAGLVHWQTGDMGPYRVNPPLVRLVCTLPLLAQVERLADSPLRPFHVGRSEWELARHLLSQWPTSTLRWRLWQARLMNLAFSLLGSLVCWRWATQAWGQSAGWIALVLVCSCPQLVSATASICPDGPAAYLTVVSMYSFRNWLRRPICLIGDAQCGLFLGCAITAKSTCGVLVAIQALLIAIDAARNPLAKHALTFPHNDRQRTGWPTRFQRCGHWVVVLVTAWCVLHTSYGWDIVYAATNRDDTWRAGDWGLPHHFLAGIREQWAWLQRGERSYLAGAWSDRGWWYYYLVCFACKTPMPTLACLSFALTYRASFRGLHSSQGGLEWTFMVLPLIVMGVVVSSQSGISQHYRYAYPCLPFVYLLASAAWSIPQPRVRIVLRLLLTFSLLSIATNVTQPQSYFNLIAGGPNAGHRWLLGSNIDWGHEVYQAAAWTKTSRQQRPVYFAFAFDQVARRVACGWLPADNLALPGTYLISVARLLDPLDPVHRWCHRRPDARIGPSIFVFHVDEEPIPRDEFRSSDYYRHER